MSGRLGDGTEAPSKTFRRVVGLPANAEVRSLALGGGHGCVVLRDGSLWCWGNLGGRLASTFPGVSRIARKVPDASALEEVVANDGLTCLRTTDGKVTCYDSVNNVGAVPAAAPVTALFSRGDQVCGRLSSGGAMCWTLDGQSKTFISVVPAKNLVQQAWDLDGTPLAVTCSKKGPCWPSGPNPDVQLAAKSRCLLHKERLLCRDWSVKGRVRFVPKAPDAGPFAALSMGYMATQCAVPRSLDEAPWCQTYKGFRQSPWPRLAGVLAEAKRKFDAIAPRHRAAQKSPVAAVELLSTRVWYAGHREDLRQESAFMWLELGDIDKAWASFSKDRKAASASDQAPADGLEQLQFAWRLAEAGYCKAAAEFGKRALATTFWDEVYRTIAMACRDRLKPEVFGELATGLNARAATSNNSPASLRLVALQMWAVAGRLGEAAEAARQLGSQPARELLPAVEAAALHGAKAKTLVARLLAAMDAQDPKKGYGHNASHYGKRARAARLVGLGGVSRRWRKALGAARVEGRMYDAVAMAQLVPLMVSAGDKKLAAKTYKRALVRMRKAKYNVIPSKMVLALTDAWISLEHWKDAAAFLRGDLIKQTSRGVMQAWFKLKDQPGLHALFDKPMAPTSAIGMEPYAAQLAREGKCDMAVKAWIMLRENDMMAPPFKPRQGSRKAAIVAKHCPKQVRAWADRLGHQRHIHLAAAALAYRLLGDYHAVVELLYQADIKTRVEQLARLAPHWVAQGSKTDARLEAALSRLVEWVHE